MKMQTMQVESCKWVVAWWAFGYPKFMGRVIWVVKTITQEAKIHPKKSIPKMLAT
jgi:hypothetical protein